MPNGLQNYLMGHQHYKCKETSDYDMRVIFVRVVIVSFYHILFVQLILSHAVCCA